MRLKKLIYFVFLFLFSCPLVAQENGTLKKIGSQLHTANLQGTTFITTKDGRQYLYTAVRGRPAHLVGFDLSTNQLVADLPIAGADGAWTITASSDGYIYVGSAQGSLFKHQPGTNTIENLGKFEGEKLIWDLVAGQNGEIYGGTWSAAKVFKYHPKEGFKDLANGSAVPGQQYAQFLAFNPKTDKLYVAIYFNADVIEINTKTGEKKSLFSQHYKEKGSIYNLKLIHTKTGDKLLVWLNNKGVGRETLVYDLKTLAVEKTLSTLEARFIQQNKNTTYYTIDGKLYHADLTVASLKAAKVLATFPAKVLASRWKNKKELQYFTADGSLINYDIKTKKASLVKLPVPPQPIDIQSIFNGPDGKIWMGGYLAGGHAYYDPKTGESKEFHGLHQTEGMAKLGTDLFFGIYPGGKIYKLDTRKPFDLKNNNPQHLINIKNQSRPFTNLTVGTRILFGTIPDYGALGGAITEYDSVTKKFNTYYDVIKNQSPTALVNRNGTIWGGTSISGGLGVAPIEKEARLFTWNMETKKVDFEIVPIPGNISFTALINGPDGNLWGFSDGYIFIYDIKQNKVTFQHKVYDFIKKRSHIWIDGKLILHSNGKIYGTGGDKFFMIDPVSKKVEILHQGVGLLAMDDDGVLYFRKEADLYSYKP
jgi:hypothetical protein